MGDYPDCICDPSLPPEDRCEREWARCQPRATLFVVRAQLSRSQEQVKALREALNMAASFPTPHRGRWHKQDPHVREGCVGCVIEDALASTTEEGE